MADLCILENGDIDDCMYRFDSNHFASLSRNSGWLHCGSFQPRDDVLEVKYTDDAEDKDDSNLLMGSIALA